MENERTKSFKTNKLNGKSFNKIEIIELDQNEESDDVQIECENVGLLKTLLKKEQRENESLKRYIDDLLKQISLMNEKLHLVNRFLYQTTGTQTDIQIDYHQPNSSIFTDLVNLKLPKTLIIDSSSENCFENETELHNKRFKADLDQFLEQIKSKNEEFSSKDYYFDEKSNTYYNFETGWYYYPKSEAFFNPSDQSYYKYDSRTKECCFWYKLEEKNQESFQTKSTRDSNDEVEEGEIFDNEDVSVSSDKRESTENNSTVIIESKPLLREEIKVRTLKLEKSTRNAKKGDDNNKVAPIRLIVVKSESLEIGSLQLISCLGGKIGQHPNCTLTIPDSTVSQIHAEVSYDANQKLYFIQDLISRNGTFVNEKRIKPLERNPLYHFDQIRLADCCQLLVHIHQHRDMTCPECEPAIPSNASNEGIYKNFKSSKPSLSSLKRKYGLDGASMSGNGVEGSNLPSGYRDRTAERQRTVGSDNPYEKTASGSGLDVSLDQRNKGFQMLKRMGWESGKSLGKDQQGSTSPIELDLRENRRHGLGFKH